jgi:CBS domain containing-hemolysin-like protein
LTTDDLTLVGIATLLALVLFLAVIEVAFNHLNKISIRTLSEGWKTEFLAQCLEEPMNFILPLRVGIQGALIGLTVLVTNFYIASGFPRAVIFSFLTMLPLILIFREALPRIISRRNPEPIVVKLLPAFRVYSRLVMPISRPLLRLVRLVEKEENGEGDEASEVEVQAFIEAGEEEGILEGDEGRLVQSIVDFGDTIVREVMTPRPDIVAIKRGATLAELGGLFVEEKYSRLPVYEDELDNISGVVFAIDFVGLRDASPDSPIDPLIRKVKFVPETKKVSELLTELQRSRTTLAVVLNEYGGTSGLVTIEDILEEIVGDIHDEFDEVDQEIVEEGKGVFLVSGRADIDEVKDKLHLDIDGPGFETVSGFLLDSLGRVPHSGEIIDREGLKIIVVEADGRRINKVRFKMAPE